MNYFLGYDAKFARIYIEVAIDDNEDMEIEMVLSKKKYYKSSESPTEKVYYEFDLLKEKGNFKINKNSSFRKIRIYRLKWISSLLVVPLILSAGIVNGAIMNRNTQWDISSIIGFIFFLITMLFLMYQIIVKKSTSDELEILKNKKVQLKKHISATKKNN
ncbi:MAG: hypothetical protein ACYCYI_02780 [Saccharofermentanales bacterium]